MGKTINKNYKQFAAKNPNMLTGKSNPKEYYFFDRGLVYFRKLNCNSALTI